MAYSEVQSILSNDKQTLIDVIRKVKDNDDKLIELDKLKHKVGSSLKRLEYMNTKLDSTLKQDTDVAHILHQLKTIIKKQQQTQNLFKLNNDSLTLLPNDTDKLLKIFNSKTDDNDDLRQVQVSIQSNATRQNSTSMANEAA
jgi:hypothetical protein